MSKKLPAWLTHRKDGCFVVDPDLAYPKVLETLGVKEKDYDQYWIEVAYQCSKMAVQEIVTGTELDPRVKGGMTLVIIIESAGGRKDRWKLANYPAGRGVTAATRGLEAKAHFPRVIAALKA